MPNWKTAHSVNALTDNPHHQAWLLERGSLTLRLKKTCPDLSVQVLEQGLTSALPDEYQRLNLKPNQPVWLRCVKIKCADLPLIYARTVIPNFNADNPWQQIQTLGTKPLGEILFSRHDLKRSDFEFCNSGHWPNLAQAYLARRCVFEQQGFPLLLTEVFLDLR